MHGGPRHRVELARERERRRAARTRELLRGGADLAASGSAGGPTPLSLARELDEVTGPTVHAAALVLRAAAPWSPSNHALFPTAARAHAVFVVWLGRQLARSLRVGGSGGLADVWEPFVMPHAVVREQGQ